MSRSLYPPCAGSAVYGPHSAKVPAAYTVIAPSGSVFYACDSDCLERFLAERRDRLMAEALRKRRPAS